LEHMEEQKLKLQVADSEDGMMQGYIAMPTRQLDGYVLIMLARRRAFELALTRDLILGVGTELQGCEAYGRTKTEITSGRFRRRNDAGVHSHANASTRYT
jgi:hypothetical protein